jgi:hypothetical protein
MLRLIACAFFLTPITSCHHCECVASNRLMLGFISFHATDIDTIVVRKFEKGNNFNHLLDTIQWDDSNVRFYDNGNAFLMGSWMADMLLKSNFDYEVTIPSTNRTYKITEIDEPQIEGDCSGKKGCVNRIVSCNVDGNFVSTDSTNQILYFKK